MIRHVVYYGRDSKRYDRLATKGDIQFVVKRMQHGDLGLYKCKQQHTSSKKNSPNKPLGDRYCWEIVTLIQSQVKMGAHYYLVVDRVRYDKFWWTGGRIYREVL